MIVSPFCLCSSVVKFLSWCDGGACWWHAGMSVSTSPLYLSLIFLLSLSLSLPLLSYRLVCLANSLPSSLCSCSPLFFIFCPISLFLFLSLLWFASPFFYLCSSAFKFKLIWWWSRWQHVGMSVFPLTSSHLSLFLSLSVSPPPPPPPPASFSLICITIFISAAQLSNF